MLNHCMLKQADLSGETPTIIPLKSRYLKASESCKTSPSLFFWLISHLCFKFLQKCLHFKAEIQDSSCNTKAFVFPEFEPKFECCINRRIFSNVHLTCSTAEVGSHLRAPEDTTFSLFVEHACYPISKILYWKLDKRNDFFIIKWISFYLLHIANPEKN